MDILFLSTALVLFAALVATLAELRRERQFRHAAQCERDDLYRACEISQLTTTRLLFQMSHMAAPQSSPSPSDQG